MNTAAVLLAGGRGKRMDILCHLRPKPALTFAGRFKVIDFSLSNCIYSNLKNIAILTDYCRSQMADYLEHWRLSNAASTNFRILEPRAGSYLGTADAVYQNLDYLNKLRVDTVLVLAGDHVYKLDYRKMFSFHQQANADVTVGVIPVPIQEAHRFGTVSIDADNRITEFLEKSPHPRSNLASMGIYVFSKDFLARRLVEDASDRSSLHDFGYSRLPGMVTRDKVFAYRFTGYWQDIGTIEAYYAANMELTSEQPRFNLKGSSPVLTYQPTLSPLCTDRQTSIRKSLVSPGCVIRGSIENSIISPGVWVDEWAVVRNSVVMENTFIGRHTIVDQCVLDEGVSVGEYCYIGYGANRLQPEAITVLGQGVSVPPHAAVGRSCKILPNVGSSDFDSNVVNHGAAVSRRQTTGFSEERVAIGES